MAISTDLELTKRISDNLVKVIDYVLEKVLKENDRIMREAFFMQRAVATTYHHTNEFFNAWDYKTKQRSKAARYGVQGAFYYSPTEEYATHSGRYMKTSEPPNANNDFMGQHHGIGGKWGDSREYLADILYLGISRNIYFGGARNDKLVKGVGINAFDKLMKYMGARKLASWINEGFSKYEIAYHFHSYPTNRPLYQPLETVNWRKTSGRLIF